MQDRCWPEDTCTPVTVSPKEGTSLPAAHSTLGSPCFPTLPCWSNPLHPACFPGRSPPARPPWGTQAGTHIPGALSLRVSHEKQTKKPPSSQRAASLPASCGCVCKRRARGAGYKPLGRALPKPQHVPRGEELRCSFCVTLPRAARLGWVKSLAHVPRAGSLRSAPHSGPVARSSRYVGDAGDAAAEG